MNAQNSCIIEYRPTMFVGTMFMPPYGAPGCPQNPSPLRPSPCEAKSFFRNENTYNSVDGKNLQSLVFDFPD